MLAIKPTAPAGSPEWLQAICRDGWTVLRMEPIAPDRTRMTITGMGFDPNDPLKVQARNFFKQGNEVTLKHMQASLARPGAADRATAAMKLLRSRVGRTWESTRTLPDGSPRISRAKWEERLPGVIEAHGDFVSGATAKPHAVFLGAIDPATGGAAFWQFMEGGTVARGHMIAMDDGKTVALDFTMTTAGGEVSPMYLQFIMDDADKYRMRLWQTRDANHPDLEPQIDLVFRAVD